MLKKLFQRPPDQGADFIRKSWLGPDDLPIIRDTRIRMHIGQLRSVVANLAEEIERLKVRKPKEVPLDVALQAVEKLADPRVKLEQAASVLDLDQPMVALVAAVVRRLAQLEQRLSEVEDAASKSKRKG